jgi:hypothetical protein
MRRSIRAALSAAAIAVFGLTAAAHAQSVGVDVYVGPPAPYYPTGPYPYPPGVHYETYGPAVVVYPRRRYWCGDTYRYWNGNHCVDVRVSGSGQQ